MLRVHGDKVPDYQGEDRKFPSQPCCPTNLLDRQDLQQEEVSQRKASLGQIWASMKEEEEHLPTCLVGSLRRIVVFSVIIS